MKETVNYGEDDATENVTHTPDILSPGNYNTVNVKHSANVIVHVENYANRFVSQNGTQIIIETFTNVTPEMVPVVARYFQSMLDSPHLPSK